jgi:hypothetical protein
MTTTLSAPESRFDWQRLGPLLAAAAMFLLVYAVELSGFGLSIDEELATFSDDRGLVWLQQGRWGMSLLTWILPNFEAIPVLSTMLLGGGLIASADRGIRDFRLRGGSAVVFAVVLVGFPVWLHIAQFSTLAAGFGIGLAAASYGASACADRRWSRWLCGVALIAFAASVYQTLAVYALMYMVLQFYAAWFAERSQATDTQTRIRLLLRLGAGWVAGLLVYSAIQSLGLTIFGKEMTYVGGFLQLERLRQEPLQGALSSGKFVLDLVDGRYQIYLHWGVGILFMTWLGLMWPRSADERDSQLSRHIAVLVVAFVGIALLWGPELLTFASLPTRAQVAWPLLAAWLAARCPFPDVRAPWVRVVALAYFAIVATSIGASVFYTDQVVRSSDREITQRLVPAMMLVAGDALPPGQPIQFTVSGIHRFPMGGQIQAADMFGVSFFEQDGGNVWRITRYWQVLGIDNFQPQRLGTRPDLVALAATMPNWPAKGSVVFSNGVVVVKFGPATPGQLAVQ